MLVIMKADLRHSHAIDTDEVASLLPHLLLASIDHRELGRELQTKVLAFRNRMTASIEGAWSTKAEVDLVKDRLIGQEERTREAWLAAQRKVDLGGEADATMGTEDADSKPSTIVTKPTLGEWTSRSKFL
jgi:hypothetical protein